MRRLVCAFVVHNQEKSGFLVSLSIWCWSPGFLAFAWLRACQSEKKHIYLYWWFKSLKLEPYRAKLLCCKTYTPKNCESLIRHLSRHRQRAAVVLIFFHILVLHEYWVLEESRLLLKPVLGAWEFLHFPLVLVNRLNKTESVVFLYCRFSLFLMDPFSRLFLYVLYWSIWVEACV